MVLNSKKLGGFGKIVVIDESKFGKRKYNKGHRVQGQWIFGGFGFGSGNLLSIIKNCILPGTLIRSDCSSAYRG